MTVTYVSEELRIDATTSISISDIVPDPDSGGYVRRVEFYTDALNTVNRRPVVTIMMYGDKEALKVQTPTLSF